jgi:hypothetical protein
MQLSIYAACQANAAAAARAQETNGTRSCHTPPSAAAVPAEKASARMVAADDAFLLEILAAA